VKTQTLLPIASYIAGYGYHLPEKVVPNSFFESYLDTTESWIEERTGIKERRWVEKGVSTSDFALPACSMAIESAGLSVADIDGVICATVTPDYIFPSTASIIQGKLGIKNGLAFDVNAVCSGFIYAITVADSLIARGLARNIIVVGVDLYSRIINPNDRTTCVLFGDGAGAVVLKANTKQDGRGIIGALLEADGSQTDILKVPSGTAFPPTKETIETDAHYLTMAGKEVFKLAVKKMAEVSLQLLVKLEIDPLEVDFFICHQANKRILDATARILNVGEECFPSNVERVGNTSAASIPILLAELREAGTLKDGQLILLNAFGGGTTWGAVLVRV